MVYCRCADTHAKIRSGDGSRDFLASSCHEVRRVEEQMRTQRADNSFSVGWDTDAMESLPTSCSN